MPRGEQTVKRPNAAPCALRVSGGGVAAAKEKGRGGSPRPWMFKEITQQGDSANGGKLHTETLSDPYGNSAADANVFSVEVG